MMKQVGLTITDEHYELLVREAGKRMSETGKITAIATLAYELLAPSIENMNGNLPTHTPTNDSEQDNEPLNNPLADLDI